MSARHEILGGKVQLYRRGDGRFWQCSTSIGGVQHRSTTKKEELRQAEDAAEDWYLELRGKFKRGELGELVRVDRGKTFEQSAEQFIREFPVITEGQRNKQYVEGHERRIRKYLIPFFGDKPVSQVTSGLIQEYRIHRAEESKAATGKPPARNTMHQEIVALRQVLKTAMRHGDISTLPDLSQPYRTNAKISHRAWFSPDEYKELYKATRERVENPRKKKFQQDYEELHDYVLFMVNTGLRPDESRRIEFRDVKVVNDRDSGERILEIDVRGKRGVGFCKSMPGAVLPFQRVAKRRNPKPTDLVFPRTHHELFNTILGELGLKADREGQRRTFYSLRHTYICLRLMEGADVYQIAKNCRTSVKMIEDFYASHIKNTVDASIVNVRRSKQPKAPKRPTKRGKNTD
ncbi:site-specific integrase [Bradyrhizobium sp. BR13661]|jgi:integrase|uniref:tyrosine-type recombinase/integrase n=2 Tax=Bacteria TaxID=2 RepID=UPI002475A063|nr:site-specific integrase [Bradyrhizobium sp. BR13661]MDH6258410.1 integrase [Bradyrhizobium sp. BR13661]